MITGKQRRESEMGECRLNHSVEDVRNKLKEQSPYLPQGIAQGLAGVLDERLDQETLNEIFHLLKKYDLADWEERAERERKLARFIE
jgi:hypothetical protein